MKIDHIALWCCDLERARNFFVTYFDASSNEMYHNPRTGLRTYFLTLPGGGKIEIMNRREVSPLEFDRYRQGYAHIAVSVGSKQAVDRLTSRLAADGYEILSGPRTTGDGCYESSVRAFENNLIEITE